MNVSKHKTKILIIVIKKSRLDGIERKKAAAREARLANKVKKIKLFLKRIMIILSCFLVSNIKQ